MESLPLHQQVRKKTYLLDVTNAQKLTQDKGIKFSKNQKGTKFCKIALREPDGIIHEFNWEQFLRFITCIEMDETCSFDGRSLGFLWNQSRESIQINIALFNPSSDKNDAICHITYKVESKMFEIKISDLPYFHNHAKPNEFICAEIGRLFLVPNGSQKTKKYQEITFPFCGVPNPEKDGTFHLQDQMNKLLNHLMRKQKDKFQYFLSDRLDLLNEFSYITFIGDKLKEHLITRETFEEFFKSVGGTIFTYLQPVYNHHQLLKLQIDLYNQIKKEIYGSLCINQDLAFEGFIYIVPQIIRILKFAQEYQTKQMHEKIHVQIDCSFKVTKPFVYCVPRVEVFYSTLPLGIVITPTERYETFQLFFDSLQELINRYNSYSGDKISFNYKTDILFISDLGAAEKRFFDFNKLSYVFCLRHFINLFGANTPLARIASEIFAIETVKEWKSKRDDYFSQLKKLWKEYPAKSDNRKKIERFALQLGLSKNISQSDKADPWKKQLNCNFQDEDQNEKSMNDNICHFLPFLRDFCSTTTNATEGGHGKFNRISSFLGLLKRIIALVKMILNEIETKTFIDPFEKRLKRFRNNQDKATHECNDTHLCPIATQMKSIFGVPICYHHCEKEKKGEFLSYLNTFVFWKNPFTLNPDLCSFPPIIYHPQNGVWLISKKYIHLTLKGIKYHNFKEIDSRPYFERAMEHCFFWISKYEKHKTIEEITTYSSYLLNKYFIIQPESFDVPTPKQELKEDSFKSILKEIRISIRNRFEIITGSPDLYKIILNYYSLNYENQSEKASKVPLLSKYQSK